MENKNNLKKGGLLSKLSPLNFSKKTKSLICGITALIGGILSFSEGANASVSKTNIDLLNQNQLGISDTKNPGITEVKNPLLIEKKQIEINNLDNINKSFIVYKIKWGDTLSKLSTRFKVNMDELVILNNISNPNKIFEGNTIMIQNNIGYVEKKSKDTKPKISKKKIPLKIKPKLTVDEEYTDYNKITSIERNTSTSGNIPVFDQKLKEETFISNKKNFEVIYSYAKIYHKKDISKILATKDTNEIKQKKIIELYFRDEKCFESRISIKVADKIKPINGISNKVQRALELGGYNITVNELLKTIMKVESSGGAYIDFVKLAGKTSKKDNRKKYLKKALNGAVGKSNDCGPFNITPNWIATELRNGGKLKGKIVTDIVKLRQQLKIVFEIAARKKLNEKQVINLLKKVDIRFDINQMSTLILRSFARIHGNFKSRNLNDRAAVKGTIMAYNIGESRTYKRLKKDTTLEKTPRDTQKKLSFLKIASIKNDTLINNSSNNGNETVNNENSAGNDKIVKLTDYYPKAVEIITSNIENQEKRTSIQKKLGDNPLKIIDKNIAEIRKKGTKEKRTNIISLFKIRNKIEEITSKQFKKAA